MKISVNWLKELCPTTLSVDEIARTLTAVGLEVEGTEHRDVSGGVSTEGGPGVVAAKVVTRTPVEGSDHLSLCEVDDGTRVRKVVCGAQNYTAGDVVPLARPGAELPNGMKIAKAKLRGIESEGMLCSARELGLSDDHAGLLQLPKTATLGAPIASLLGLPDVVFEVNVTPNRPDALSHIGVARELAAALGLPFQIPLNALSREGATAAGDLPVHAKARVDVEDAQGCPRYLARVIEGVKVGPSPMHLQERLRACGVRSISNVVDATNLALLELGHPLHGFDLDKLGGARIVVRRAHEGETIKTLDEKDRTLTAQDLVICDGAGPVALAGIMGGATSEVGDSTTRVLLESAVFEGKSVRRTAKRQGLSTEASTRFEKGADEETARLALDRCAQLIVELAGGKVVEGAIDRWPSPREATKVWVRPARVNAILGCEVPTFEIEKRLKSLGLTPVGGTEEQRQWQVPGFRRDLTREIDCIEEVARQRGLDTIPIRQHPAGLGTTAAKTPADEAVKLARAQLAARGYDEALNYSFVAQKELSALVPRTASAEAHAAALKPVLVQNPLTIEQGAMRTSMIPGLLRNLQQNLARGAADVRLYELGRVYLPKADARHPEGKLAWPVAEPTRIGIVAQGRAAPRFWLRPDEKGKEALTEFGFFDLKGAIVDLAEALRVPLEVRPASELEAPHLHPAAAASVWLGGSGFGETRVGTFGELHPLVAQAFDVPANTLVAELDWEPLSAKAQLVPQSQGVPRFPSVQRDLALVVDAIVPAAKLLAEIRAADASGLLRNAELFDLYRGAQVAAGKKSVAISLLLRAEDRTLTDADAEGLMAAVKKRLKDVLDAEIRA
ncbi:MAG: phenylalanine--tRNA ligase subunit beta [Deltaproteobacteria bacterium]|nr:phenylalanine--tRNA ligase subunit beta [Deltaproteobacteria bacterium]